MKKIRPMISMIVLGAVFLGGCTLAFPEAPMSPVVVATKPTVLKKTEVCNGTFAADTTTESGKTIQEAAKKAGIHKIVSIRYETRDFIFFTRLCAVVKGT